MWVLWEELVEEFGVIGVGIKFKDVCIVCYCV